MMPTSPYERSYFSHPTSTLIINCSSKVCHTRSIFKYIFIFVKNYLDSKRSVNYNQVFKYIKGNQVKVISFE